ncbi:NAD-dependent epimerase/dehydratase family protein [Gracilimonas mengyeensis]|uniref:Nucleoside-diphosphate-sugar epimerase n=1 Tax=Gracilimonas mengyeensis TaxID=1302730 RepID=A0A521F719_9BACT|nr:NAD-dependent epimerase/dehydratase family protein [Gracilimonas mengyeensis]SMO91320.1 Nucleoside-diphosphate-sugar epimerase [Gracilimonas mengyeensis]
MKAFVTGGTGFIGSHLVEALIKSSDYDEVRCLVRNQEKWLSGHDFKQISGDLNDLSALGDGLQGVDVLFHVAGIVKAPTKKEFTQANVDATENLVRLAQKKGVKNLVILSSLAAAGPSNGHPKTERDPMEPVSMYGESKKEMEDAIARAASKEESIKIIRPPAVYGPREDQIFSFFQAFSKGICPIVGDGNNPRVSMVYVSDLVDGIMLAAEKQEAGVHTYFISGEGTHSWNEIKAITGRVLGKKAIPIKIKPNIVKKVAGVIENVASLFGKYPVINREKASELILEWTCSPAKAEKELNYRPKVSLAEGISRTIHWYKMHNWL